MPELKTSDAQRKAVKRYQSENVENITYRVKRGRREEIKRIAACFGMSTNQLIDTALNEYIDQHSNKNQQSDSDL